VDLKACPHRAPGDRPSFGSLDAKQDQQHCVGIGPTRFQFKGSGEPTLRG